MKAILFFNKIYKKVVRGLLSFLVLFMLFGCSSISEKTEAQIVKGLDFYEQGAFEESKVVFDNIVDQKRIPDEVWYYKASVEIGVGDIATAKRDIQKFMLLQPDHIEGKVIQAYIYNLLEDTPEALVLLQEVLVEDPNHELAQSYIAMIHIKNADYKLAEPFLLHLVEQFPQNPEYMYILGSMYSDRGFESGEEKYTTKALTYLYDSYKIDNSNINTQLYLGISLIDAKRYEQAATVLAVLIQNNPKNGLSWTHLGVSLSKLGRENQAISALNTALELDPSSVVASNELQKLGSNVKQLGYVIQSSRFMSKLELAGRGIDRELKVPSLINEKK